MANAAPARQLPRCKCDTDRESRFCVVERQYGFFGILYLVWGGTAIPIKVTFKCVKCGTLFDQTTSESECRRYIT